MRRILPPELVDDLCDWISKQVWEKCMFGYVIHTKKQTIRIWDKR